MISSIRSALDSAIIRALMRFSVALVLSFFVISTADSTSALIFSLTCASTSASIFSCTFLFTSASILSCTCLFTSASISSFINSRSASHIPFTSSNFCLLARTINSMTERYSAFAWFFEYSSNNFSAVSFCSSSLVRLFSHRFSASVSSFVTIIWIGILSPVT